DERVFELKQFGFLKTTTVSKKDILEVQRHIMSQLREPSSELYSGMSLVAQCMKIMHAQELIETQSVHATKQYLSDLFEDAKTSKTKATQSVAQDIAIKLLYQKLNEYTSEHPKIEALCQLVKNIL